MDFLLNLDRKDFKQNREHSSKNASVSIFLCTGRGLVTIISVKVQIVLYLDGQNRQ